VRGWFELNQLGLFFGDAASGKTWVLLALGLHIAAGREFFGARVHQGAVFVICGEGFAGVRRRTVGMSQHYGIPLAGLPFFVSERAATFSDRESVADVVDTIRALATETGQTPVLVIVDTVARNFGAADENSTSDMGAFVQTCDTIKAEFGCHVALSHHVGHNDKTRARGNTALRGALDCEFRVIRDEAGTIEVTCDKMKDGEAPQPRRFRLEPVTLDWIDEDGEPVTTAALVPTDAELVAPQKPGSVPGALRGRHQKAAHRLLLEAYDRHRANLERSGRDPDAALVSLDEWRDLCTQSGMDRYRFRDARSTLENVGLVRTENGHVHLGEGFV
jgi:hypothetical protein